MKKIRVLVIGDSLSIPRFDDYENIEWENVWNTKLRENYEVAQIGIGGAMISDLLEQAGYWRLFHPDFVIIQSGIVDCAPRTLTNRERKFLESMPFGIRLFGKLIKKNSTKIRNSRNITMTELSKFEECVVKFNKMFEKSKVLFIGIAPAREKYEGKIKGITKNINLYNDVLKKHSGEFYIDISDLPETGLLPDFHHLSKIGHQFLYDKIMNKISNIQFY